MTTSKKTKLGKGEGALWYLPLGETLNKGEVPGTTAHLRKSELGSTSTVAKVVSLSKLVFCGLAEVGA